MSSGRKRECLSCARVRVFVRRLAFAKSDEQEPDTHLPGDAEDPRPHELGVLGRAKEVLRPALGCEADGLRAAGAEVEVADARLVARGERGGRVLEHELREVLGELGGDLLERGNASECHASTRCQGSGARGTCGWSMSLPVMEIMASRAIGLTATVLEAVSLLCTQ